MTNTARTRDSSFRAVRFAVPGEFAEHHLCLLEQVRHSHDRHAQIIIQRLGFGVQRLQDPDLERTDGILAPIPEDHGPVFRHTAAKRHILRGAAPVDHGTALDRHVRRVHDVVVVGVRDKDGAQAVNMVELNELVAQGGVGLHLRTHNIFIQRRPGKMRIEQDLVDAIVKQQSRCTEKSNL